MLWDILVLGTYRRESFQFGEEQDTIGLNDEYRTPTL
jgi:hypothetical protein